MKGLNEKVNKKYAYVKKGVIFNISSINNGDKCAEEITSANTPYITVCQKGVEEECVSSSTKYFDSYIEDGDIYENGTFKKTVHGENGDEEVTFQDYYYSLCEAELATIIADNYEKSIEELKNSTLGNVGFPLYMIKGMGYSVTGVTQISLEEKYVELKENEIKKRILSAASDVANIYGYDLLNTVDDIEIEER